MKRYLILVLLLALFVSCAEEDFRPDWKIIYPQAIGDSQGLLSYDVQQFYYAEMTSDPNLSVWITSSVPAELYVGGSAESNSTAYTNTFALTNGVNNIQIAISNTGFGGTIYSFACTYFNPDGDARLQDLQVNGATIYPTFDTLVYTYRVFASNTSVEVVPTAFVVNPSITVNGTSVASGATHTVSGLSDGSNNIPVQLISADNTSTNNYTLIAYRPEEYPSGLNLTTVNYSFDGGVQTALDNCSSTMTPSSFSNVVEGVVTAKSGSYLWMQDNTAGILFYGTSLNNLVDVGDRIQIACLGGYTYNGLKEISVINTNVFSKVSTGNALYYQTGPIDASCVGQFWLSDLLLSIDAEIGNGNHDIDGWGQVRVANGGLPEGAYKFYGPVSQYNTTIQLMVY